MKRIFALALCLAVLCPTALAEVFVVYYDTQERGDYYSLLIRDDGTPLTPSGTYQSIFPVTPQDTPEDARLYSVMSSVPGMEYDPGLAEEMLYDTEYARVGLMDARGEMLTGFDYTGLSYANGYVIFTLPGELMLSGAMDTKGKIVMPAEYAAIEPLTDGRWLAMPQSAAEPLPADSGDEDDVDYRYAIHYIDSDGDVRDLGLHATNRYFSVNPDGICAIWGVEEYDGGLIFIDADGTVMFDRGFEGADNFVGDYAMVRTEDGAGIIDKDGNFVVPPEFDYVYLDDDRRYIASRGSRVAVFSAKDCKALLDMSFYGADSVDIRAFGDDMFLVRADESQMLYGPYGELLAEFPGNVTIQGYGQPPRSVGRLIWTEGDWPDERARLIDLKGNVVCDDCRELSLGAWRGDEARFITVDFDDYTDAQGERMVRWSSYRYGLMDQDGNQLLPTRYDEIQALSFDRYWVSIGPLCGMIDETGKWYYTISDYEELLD